MLHTGDTMGYLTRWILIGMFETRNVIPFNTGWSRTACPVSWTMRIPNKVGSRIPYANQPRGVLKF